MPQIVKGKIILSLDDKLKLEKGTYHKKDVFILKTKPKKKDIYITKAEMTEALKKYKKLDGILKHFNISQHYFKLFLDKHYGTKSFRKAKKYFK